MSRTWAKSANAATMADMSFLIPAPVSVQIVIRRGFWTTKILKDGQPLARKGALNSSYVLPQADGSAIELRLKGFFNLTLEVGGARYPLERRLRPHEYLLVGFPYILLAATTLTIRTVANGALGVGPGGMSVTVNSAIDVVWVGLGAIGVIVNTRIARLAWREPVRVLAMLGFSAVLVVIDVVAVTALKTIDNPAVSTPSSTIASSPTAGTPAGWITFVAPDGSFSVALPGTPYEKSTRREAPGSLPYIDHETGWASSDRSTGYWVNLFDYAAGSMGGVDAKKWYDSAQVRALAAAGLTLVNANDVVLDGHPGREYTATGDGYTVTVRMYLVGDRLYKQDTNSTHPVAGDVQAFLASFRITRPLDGDGS